MGVQCDMSTEITPQIEPLLLDKKKTKTNGRGIKEQHYPICSKILTSEKKAKFFTHLDKEDRKALWDFLGEAKGWNF